MIIKQLPFKKRHRQEEDQGILGLGEHHTKRRNITATHQIPPNLSLPTASNLSCCRNYSHELSSCTVTLKLLNSEKGLSSSESRLCLLSYQPPSATTGLPCGNPLSSYSNRGEGSVRHSFNQVPRNPNFPDNIETIDTFRVLSNPLYHNLSPNITGGMPKQIRNSFTPINLNNEAAVDFVHNMRKVDLFKRNSRLSKSVNEIDSSPTVIVNDLSDMQMDVEDLRLSDHILEPTKRDEYVKSKDIMRLQSSKNRGRSEPRDIKKSFSMGYRTNCEKCRLKVPGHFSHIITS